MADNRIKQVADALKTALTGLDTTGSNVYVHKASEFEPSKLPAIDITLGEVSKVNADVATQDLEQTFIVSAVVANNSEYWQQLLQIQKEVHIAIRADYVLGLAGIVHDAKYEGSGRVLVDGEGNSVIAMLDMEWVVQLRTSINDVSG